MKAASRGGLVCLPAHSTQAPGGDVSRAGDVLERATGPPATSSRARARPRRVPCPPPPSVTAPPGAMASRGAPSHVRPCPTVSSFPRSAPPLASHTFCAARGPPWMSGATATPAPHALAPPGLGFARSGALRRAQGRGRQGLSSPAPNASPRAKLRPGGAKGVNRAVDGARNLLSL